MTELHFLPWSRAGAAAALNAAAVQAGADRPQLNIALSVSAQTPGVPPSKRTANMALRMLGPGDVVGFAANQVIRTEPADGSTGVETELFVAVEFDDPSLPWLMTPEVEDQSTHRLRPWICLIVVPESDVSYDPQSRQLTIPNASRNLPDLQDSWAWAHVQYTGELSQPIAAGALETILEQQPNATISRVLCFRQLQEHTRYLACVVPTYRSGVEAGLGATPPEGAQHQPAWDASSTAAVTLPVLHQFGFSTGEGGDFLSLAEALAHPPDTSVAGSEELGQRTLGLEHAGFPAPPTDLPLPSVLASPDQPAGGPERPHPIEPEPPAVKVEDALREQLTRPAGAPRLLPPVYGAMQAGVSRGQLDSPRWMHELNLSPALRTISALGAKVVQSEQEQLIAGAWQQIEGTQEVNALLARARLARASVIRQVERHLSTTDPVELLRLTNPHAERMQLQGQTIAERTEQQGSLAAAVSAPYRRLARPRGAVARRVEVPSRTVAGIQAPQIIDALAPGAATETRVLQERLSEVARTAAAGRRDQLQDIPATVSFTSPMSVPLTRLSPDAMLAGASAIKPNTALTLATNNAVIASYMVGLNSELNRELTWRGVPVDRRATPMRCFWDRRGSDPSDADPSDIKAISEWPEDLPLANQLGAEHELVLLVRAELLRRYPNTAVYAVKARTTAQGTHVLDETTISSPRYTALLPPDIRLFIFGTPSPEDAIGEPGWFFVLQEQASETRFAGRAQVPAAYWRVADLETKEGLSPGANAAQVAEKARLAPVRCAIHARALLPQPPAAQRI
jgi:hypothetical protein